MIDLAKNFGIADADDWYVSLPCLVYGILMVLEISARK